MRSNADVSHSMRLLDRRARVSPALVLYSFVCALGALLQVSAAQPWLPLMRESGPQIIAEVFFEAQSMRNIDSGVFEIRLMYEPVAWTCVRRSRDGECDIHPDRVLLSKRITVIRIRCSDQSYEEVAVWVGFPPSWRQLQLWEFRHPPGWRYDIASLSAVAAARDLVCTTVTP